MMFIAAPHCRHAALAVNRGISHEHAIMQVVLLTDQKESRHGSVPGPATPWRAQAPAQMHHAAMARTKYW
jgi:hypothetical protein